MEYILSSLDMIAGITENLINYTFNVRLLSQFMCLRLLTYPFQMASYEMNEVMYVPHNHLVYYDGAAR